MTRDDFEAEIRYTVGRSLGHVPGYQTLSQEQMEKAIEAVYALDVDVLKTEGTEDDEADDRQQQELDEARRG